MWLFFLFQLENGLREISARKNRNATPLRDGKQIIRNKGVKGEGASKFQVSYSECCYLLLILYGHINN